MKTCFGYVRVSTVKQGEGVSLEAQREAIEQFAGRSDIAIVKWFEEKQTAAKSGRPVFNAMLRLLKRRKADGVIMHKIDRSARNFADWAKIGALSDAGIDVHFATESLDFRSRGGRLSADIQAVIAADYIRNLRDETIKGITGRLKQGLYPFKAPIGYVDNGRGNPKTPDPIRAPFIRQAFDLYASGSYSFISLTTEMKRRGLVNDRGRALTKGGMEKVLKNPFYFGLIRITTTGDSYPGIHTPLISASIFERVQAIRAGKSHKKVTRHNFRYRALFLCRSCGLGMVAERQRGHVYYRCHGPDCPTRCVREEKITQAVLEMLHGVQFSPATVEKLALATQKYRQSDKERLRALELQLTQTDSRLQRLADAFIDNMIDPDTYQTQRTTLLTQKIRVSEEIKSKAAAGHDANHPQQFLEHMKSLPDMFISATPEEQREIVEITTSNRRVLEKDVYVEPAKWLSEAHLAAVAYCGDPHRPTFRRRRQSDGKEIERLIDATGSQQAKRLFTLIRGSSSQPHSNAA